MNGQSYDKQYELWQALKAVNWAELPPTFSAFSDSLKNRAFFDKSHQVIQAVYPDAEESKLSNQEFFNLVNGDRYYKSNVAYYDTETSEEEPWYESVAKSVGQAFGDIGAVTLGKDLHKSIEAQQNINEFGLQALQFAKGLPGFLSNLAAFGVSPEMYRGREKEIREYLESGGVKDKIIEANIKDYVDLRKRLREDWSKAGIVKETPTPSGEFFGQAGFTVSILGASLIPGVGIPTGFTMGMSAEAMELAADVYEGTNGNIEATKYAFGIGTLLGATEMFTPLEAVSFAKKGVSNLIKKEIKQDLKKGFFDTYFRTSLKEVGKEFVTEASQEAFQTWGEQKTYIDVGMSDKIDWNEILKAGALGGVMGALMGAGAATYGNIAELQKLSAYVEKDLPAKLDKYISYGLITEEEKANVLKQFEGWKNLDDLKERISTTTPVEMNEGFRGKAKTFLKAQKLYEGLLKAFESQSSSEGMTRAMEIAQSALEKGIPLNTLDLFLLDHMQSAGVKIPEFDDIEVMHSYTNTILKGVIEKSKEFNNVKADVKAKTNETGEALTTATHNEIFSNEQYKDLREGYLNSLVNGVPVLEAIESSIKEDSYYYEPSDGEMVLNMASRPLHEMSDRELEAFIRRRNNKLTYTNSKDAVRFAGAIKEYNSRKTGKKYSFGIVPQGENRYVYEIRKGEGDTQLEIFEQKGKGGIKVISGGQTGVDRIGLEIGKELGLETGGTAPRGYKTERGEDTSLKEFGLKEDITDDYRSRTEKNLVESDGTVIFSKERDQNNDTTVKAIKRSPKDIKYIYNPNAEQLRQWMQDNNIKVLNVAGNRASKLTEQQQKNIGNILRQALTFKPNITSPENLAPVTIEPPTVAIKASDEIKRLSKAGFTDSAIAPAVEWLSEMHGDIELRSNPAINTPARFVWDKANNKKWIEVNYTHEDLRSPNDLYRAIAHELIHNASFQILRTDAIFRKRLRDLYTEVESRIKGTTFYEENKDDLDRIFEEKPEKQLDEFLGYVLSNTSVLREWMNTTEFKPGSTYLKRLYQQIMDGLKRIFNKSPKSLTYLQAMETLANQAFNMATTTIEPLGIPFYPQLLSQQYNTADVLDKALALEDEALGDARSMTGFLDSLGIDLGRSPYEYIQGLTKPEFYDIVDKSPKLLEKMEVYWDKKFKGIMTFDEYKQKVSTYVYNNIHSVKKRKTVSLIVDSLGIPSARIYDKVFKTRKGDIISNYHQLTMMDDILPLLNEIFGTKFEIVYLEEVIDESGFVTISGKAHKVYFDLDNGQLQDLYSKAGIIFPGTWADKDTLIGLVELDENGNVATGRNYSELEEGGLYNTFNKLVEMYNQRMQALVESGTVTEEYLNQIDRPTIATIVRLVMEDLRLGGRMQGGEFVSALFDPNYADAYDAIKIFKRPYLVAPKYVTAQLAEEVRYIVDKVVKEIYGGQQDLSGIVVRNGKVYFRAIIFDDEADAITIGDRTISLKNEYGTSIFDGGFVYGLGGFDSIYKYLVGAVKQGAIKLWGGNSVSGEFSAPFFLKTAGHGFSQKDNIVQWARANNISLILPASAVKVNRYDVGNLMGTEEAGNVIEIPMDNLYRLQEKDEITDTARGLQQTITANFMTYANEAFTKADEKKEFWNLVKQFTDNIIRRFHNQTTAIDKQSLLEYIKDVIQNPENEYHRGLSQVLSSMLTTYADERVSELTDEEYKNEKEMVEELLRDQRLQNTQLAEKISGLFYHPYFSKIFEDYMHRVLKELLYYELPAGYSVLTPDLGWLAQTRIDLASKYALNLVKEEIEQEISNVYYGVQQPREQEIATLQDEIKALEERGDVLGKEYENIKKNLDEAVKKEQVDRADRLKQVLDDNQKELDGITEEIDKKQVRITELEKSLVEPRKKTEGYIVDGRVVVDGRKTSVQEARDKLLYQWIDENTGRIKGDYVYYSAESAKARRIKLGDTVITGVIPSDSAQSISGATVIGIMNKSISETNKIVGRSEYFQTQLGKDFDFDTALVIAYDRLFGTRVDFQKLADIFTATKDNYPAYILKTMRRVLNMPNLRQEDIYNKELRLRYMQSVAAPTEAPAVYNPLYNQSILNKYKKEIGQVVNKRKMATFKSLVNFRTRFLLFDNAFILNPEQSNTDRTHLFHLIETNAKVDMPTDDTSLKYVLEAVREFDIENGTNLEEAARQMASKSEKMEGIVNAVLPKYLRMFRAIDKFLFGYGVKLSTVNNLDDFNESRTLYDSVRYMRIQKRINDLLKTKEGKLILFRQFSETFRVKASDSAKARMMEVARQYIEEIQIDDIFESVPMYITENTDLTTLPNIKLETNEYIRTEESVARQIVLNNPLLKETFKKMYEKYKPVADNIANQVGSRAAFNKLLFLLTIDNEKLHILKGKILRLVNMFVRAEGLFKPLDIEVDGKKYSLTRFFKDLSVKVDEEIFGDMLNAVLNKDVVEILKSAPEKTEMNVNGKIMTVEHQNGILQFTIKDRQGNTISVNHTELSALIKTGNPVGKAFQKYFSEAFGQGLGKNRAAIASIVDFSNTLDLMDRWELIGRLVVPEFESLNNEEKQLLMASLLSYSETANESIYSGKEELSNDRLFTFLSLFRNDPAVTKFITDYAVGFTNSVPHPGFTKGLDTIKVAVSSDADIEIWNMQSPKKKNLQKNLKDLMIEEKNIPYRDNTTGVSRVVNLRTGNVTDMTIDDVSLITQPYVPKATTAKGDIEVLYATVLKHLDTVAALDSYYKETDIEISKLEEQYFQFGDERVRNFTKSQELKKLRESVEELVSNNPHNITIEKNQAGRYIYNYRQTQYSDIEDLLDAIGIRDLKERIKHKTALKWQILYSVENPIVIQSMLNYLNSVVFDFGRNSLAIQTVTSMIKRYNGFLHNIKQRQFRYYPRVYRQHIFETKIMNYLKAQEAERINKEIEAAVEYVRTHQNQTIPDAIRRLATRQGDTAWILSRAKLNIERERFNIGVGTYGKFINSFSLKRQLPDEIDGVKYYVRDSMLPHHRHQAQMLKMFKNDLLFINWLSYQHKALVNGTDIETIEDVKIEMATISGNRMLLSRDIATSEILPGMEVSFYYVNDRYYSGVVDRVDGEYVYLKLDKTAYERYLREQLEEYEKTHLSIISNASLNDKDPTYKQLATLGDLADQGYLDVGDIMQVQSIPDASQLIIDTLRSMLDSSETWGRYRKRDMTRRNPSLTGDVAGENGAYRYIEFGSLEYLRGMARELNNTYDGKLSTETFGDIIKSDKILAYLKYEMLMMPGRLLDLGSKALALIGLSTPSAAIKNTYDGMAGVIRDRGFVEFFKLMSPVVAISRAVKKEFKAGEVTPDENILETVIAGGQTVFREDKKKVAAEISKRFMLEQGLIFEDYLLNSVAGNIEELFIEDEKNQIDYKVSERVFNLYKIIKDAWGFKEHRDKIIKLEKELYETTDVAEARRLMQEIAAENTRWDTLYNQRMAEAATLARRYTTRQVQDSLMKINLAEMHNKTTAELIPMMAKVIAGSDIIGYLLGTRGFKRAEGHIRRMTAINYIYDAIRRGETDVNLIKIEAAKGIARTQALYDVINRRLGDRTKLGRFALMFGQYPYYMLQTVKATLKQAKAEDRSDLKQKLGKEWYRDTVLSGFNFFFQGLRIGSPINVTINATLILLLQALANMGDDKEPFDFSDWDTRDVIFSLLQFKIGMGLGLIFGTMYNLATEQERVFSIGRIGRAFDLLAKLIFPGEDTTRRQARYQNEKDIKLFIKYSVGINPLMPSYSPDYTDEDLIEHYKKPLSERWLDWWEPAIPLYPHLKYGMDF